MILTGRGAQQRANVEQTKRRLYVDAPVFVAVALTVREPRSAGVTQTYVTVTVKREDSPHATMNQARLLGQRLGLTVLGANLTEAWSW